ncbi:sigma factor-like helix-turn-helix DNA-binding protein [Methylobacterium sp. WL6]|uniref:sigma factor-like helix-turn-helix DNA-binding protein n=1 Tax=Methylobacterium sp. WL6 TaxID=2603901 RepID=UPI0032B12BCA
MRSALNHLPDAHREALLLVGVQSLSYEKAARICGIAVGTMKSRVSRARAFLLGYLRMDAADGLGVDARMLAAMPG